MARDEAYRKAEEKIEEARRSGATNLDLHGGLTELPESLGQLTQLQRLDLRFNQLTALPEWLGQLKHLQLLDLVGNQLTGLPESLGQLTQLQSLDLAGNQLTALPESLGRLTQLHTLDLSQNQLTVIPEWLGELTQLKTLNLYHNEITSLPGCMRRLGKLRQLLCPRNELTSLPEWLAQLTELITLQLFANKIKDLPVSLIKLTRLQVLDLDDNPLNLEPDAAHKEGFDAVKLYLRLKAEPQIVLNEAKLILIGEGEVGKSCLLGALRGDEWVDDRDTTHGIEIKPVKVTDPAKGAEITLNGWDFGGQRVYRPTHQLFFSAPAIYLVVWKPREGPQAGAVKDWIKLVKHREPDAKIIVVATHGGPQDRQPDIDKQEIWDLFGKDTVIDFFHVNSRPPNYDETTKKWTGEGNGIRDLRYAITKLAASLPEMGRSVPKRWQQAREALQATGAAYLPLDEVLKLCADLKMEKEEAQLFVTLSHRLGHLIHYEHDPALHDIVVLKSDWLATAISFVLDDKATRDAHGLVSLARLGKLWNDPTRPKDRYAPELHHIFVRLMERYELSYVVAGRPVKGDADGASLIAQLVPDIRPEEKDLTRAWPPQVADGDEEQVQICRIVDLAGQSANAEGLFFQLIVRLHKLSLGRANFDDSVHWQRGLVLDDDYNGRALLENIGNDVRITVRAAYSAAFLAVLTREVKWLVESFWEGLRCEVVVPCVEPCGKKKPGAGVFEVQKLIAFKRQGMTLFPCTVSGCNQAQEIGCLLQNAPASRRTPVEVLINNRFAEMMSGVAAVRGDIKSHDRKELLRFRKTLSEIDDAFNGLMQALTDEAKEGPRLFNLEPIEPGFFGKPKWVSERFRLTLWCEHSRLPLPALNGNDDRSGVYEFDIPRKWFVTAAPVLKILAGTLSLVLPVASSAAKVVVEEAVYKGMEKQLELGQKSVESVLKGGEKAGDWLGDSDGPDLERDGGRPAQGAVLRQLHAWLKEKDPGFGGLVRVRNKRQDFLWVHPQFAKEY